MSKPPPQEAVSKPGSATPEPLPLIRVDRDGDLQLRVGGEADGQEQEILVCSAALRRAAPAWNAMLFGPFKESKPAKGEWIVSLPADKAAPVLVFMNIIHSRFGELPKTPSLSLLYDICITADKYGLFDLVQPWVPQWSIAIGNQQGSEDGNTIARLTFVSWALPQPDIYRKMLLKLTLGCSVNEEGHLLMPDGTCLNDYPRIGPHNLLDSLKSWRAIRIESILTAFHDLIQKLLKGNGVVHCCPRAEECVYLTLGSIWSATTKSRGSLLPKEAGDISESLANFAASVTGILSNVKSSPSSSGYGPKTCNHTPQVLKAVQDALSPDVIVWKSRIFGNVRGLGF